MADVIVFGVKDFAELAHYYLSKDSPHNVIAFSVHRDYLPESRNYLDLPVVPFDEVESHYSPGRHKFFAPMSASNMNRDRENIFSAIKAKGYDCVSYISSKAMCFDNTIGENCFILEGNVLQPLTSIGDNVTLWSGNHIGHHGVIENHVTLTSHVVMSGHCNIGRNSFFGVNATLRDGLDVGEGTFVAMSTALTENTEPWSAYKGNPAKKLSVTSNRIKF